jgi:hypothetical protein
MKSNATRNCLPKITCIVLIKLFISDISANILSLLSQTKLNAAASTHIGLLVPESPDHPEVPRVKSSLFQISSNGSPTALDGANPADFLIVYLFMFSSQLNFI